MSQRHPPDFRSLISAKPFELRITIPLRRHWREAVEIFIFFLGSFVGGIVPLVDLATNTGFYLGEQPLLRIGLGSVFLTCSALLLCLWLWMIAGREVIIRVHPDFAGYLESEDRETLQRLAQSLGVKVTVQAASAEAGREEYEIHVR